MRVTLDFRHRDLKTSGDVGFQRDGVDQAFSVGLQGQILPRSLFNKLEAFASFSFQKVDSTVTGSQGSRNVLGYNGRIAWSPKDTTNVNFNFKKDVQTTVTDETVENSNISLGISQVFSRLMTGSLNLYLQNISYFGGDRKDDRVGLSASLSTALGRNWSAGARISYDDTNSSGSQMSDELFTYDRTQIGIFSVFRF
jgi:hypothetical protein